MTTTEVIGDADFLIRDQGTIVLLRPMSSYAEAWIEEYISDDAQWWGGSLAIDHRCAQPIIDALSEEGFALGAM